MMSLSQLRGLGLLIKLQSLKTVFIPFLLLNFCLCCSCPCQAKLLRSMRFLRNAYRCFSVALPVIASLCFSVAMPIMAYRRYSVALRCPSSLVFSIAYLSLAQLFRCAAARCCAHPLPCDSSRCHSFARHFSADQRRSCIRDFEKCGFVHTNSSR